MDFFWTFSGPFLARKMPKRPSKHKKTRPVRRQSQIMPGVDREERLAVRWTGSGLAPPSDDPWMAGMLRDRSSCLIPASSGSDGGGASPRPSPTRLLLTTQSTLALKPGSAADFGTVMKAVAVRYALSTRFAIPRAPAARRSAGVRDLADRAWHPAASCD